jgi:chromosome segregation ATPase
MSVTSIESVASIRPKSQGEAATADAVRAELERWQQEVYELDRHAALQTRELNKVRGQMSQLTLDNAALKMQGDEMFQEVTRLTSANQELLGQIAGLKKAKRSRGKTISKLQTTISAMQKSASWRLTAPMRRLRRLLSR